MKLRVKIHDHPSLRMTIEVEEKKREYQPQEEDDTAKQPITLSDIRQCLEREALLRVGYRLTDYDLSLNGTYTLASSLDSESVEELGLVSGDLLHVLNSRWATDDDRGSLLVLAPGQQLQPIRVSDLPEAHEPPAQPAVMSDASDSTATVPALLVWLVERRCRALLSRGGECRHWHDSIASLHAEQLLFTAVHVLLLEAGLAPVTDGEVEESPQSTDREQRWLLADRCWQEQRRRDGLMEARYRLCDEHLPVTDTVTVSAVRLGGVLAVHALLEHDRSLFTAQLRIAHYINRLGSREGDTVTTLDSQQAVNAARAMIAGRFTHLRQLSSVFRSALVVPLLVQMRSARGQVSPYEWRALPYEIQLMIMRALPVRDLLSLGATGRQQQSRTSESLLWRWLVLRDFPRHRHTLADQLAPHSDWRQRYIELYQQRRRRALNQEPTHLLPRIGTLPFILEEAIGWPELGSSAEGRDGWEVRSRAIPPLARVVNGGKYDRIPGLYGLDWTSCSTSLPPLALPHPLPSDTDCHRFRRLVQPPQLNDFI